MAHITVSNIVLGPALFLVPVATGLLVRQVGMHTGIGLTLIPTAAGIIWLTLMVKEPRDLELRHTPSGDDASPHQHPGHTTQITSPYGDDDEP